MLLQPYPVLQRRCANYGITLWVVRPHSQEDCHPWVMAVSLRILDGHLSRCTHAADQARPQAVRRAALWFHGCPAAANESGMVTAPTLVRSLVGLISSDRLEREPTNAPL